MTKFISSTLKQARITSQNNLFFSCYLFLYLQLVMREYNSYIFFQSMPIGNRRQLMEQQICLYYIVNTFTSSKLAPNS